MATNNAINLRSAGIVSYDGAGNFTALANPLTVPNGGTANSSFTAYTVLCAGTTSTGALQNVASVGSVNQALTSNGAGALPSFQNKANSPFYAIRLVSSGASPADASTYFLGYSTLTTMTSSQSTTRVYIPYGGTINIMYGKIRSGVTGSNQTSTLYLRVNNTTDHVISSTIANNVTNATFNTTTLGVVVSAGDFVEFKWVTPTWSPNPTSVSFSVTFMVSI